jgi:LacI family transcriptional regulator, gluconate utilization system Gnt-I transcriptional repressor
MGRDKPPKPEPLKGRKDTGGGVTMQTVARLAGVSAMTVSRALRSESLVSRDTRERVLEIVRETGYVPDASARVFASRRSGFVAALVPSLNNSNFAETVHAMADVFDRVGLQMLLGDTQYSVSREESLIATFLQRRPEAILLTGGFHTPAAKEMLKRADIPIVETWETPARPLGHVVGFSNKRAGAEMARYLYARGRRRIAFVGSGADRDRRGFERRAGYLQAVAELGLPQGRVVRIGAPPAAMGHGAEALARVLEAWPDTDGIVCVSDLQAFGVLSECQRRGIQAPEQIALIGFGDFEVGRFCHPRLTTIGIDCAAIGRIAAETVVGSIEAGDRGEPFRRTRHVATFSVIARETA